MPFQFEIYKPSEKFREYINYFWTIDSENIQMPKEEIIYPTGTSEIMFHYGNPFEYKNQNASSKSHFLFCGQKTKYDLVTAKGKAGAIAINFKSYAAAQFFHINFNELCNCSLTLENLIAKNIFNELQEKLFYADNNPSRVKILEHYLEKMFIEKLEYSIKHLMKADEILQNKFLIPIEKIAELSNLSLRSMQRKFIEIVGITPKQLANIYRFNSAVKLIETKKAPLIDTSFEAGYYDQAHFISDFKRYTGITPKEYLKTAEKQQ